MPEFDDKNDDQQREQNMVYDESELRPGGLGKQGDQQQMGQEREPRKDKSDNEEGSDKQHNR
jgi:hypothetical protein